MGRSIEQPRVQGMTHTLQGILCPAGMMAHTRVHGSA